MTENRRSFLRRTATALPVCWAGSRASAAAVGSAALEVRRVAADRVALIFGPSAPRAFRILQVTDTHFGNPDPAKRATDARTLKELPRLVREVAPDFLMHTGDFIDNDVEGASHRKPTGVLVWRGRCWR